MERKTKDNSNRIDARELERKKWEEEHKIIREQINGSKLELMLQINFEREKEINFILEQNNRKIILQQISIKEKEIKRIKAQLDEETENLKRLQDQISTTFSSQ